MSIEISHVSKSIGRQRILDDVSLRVEDGELVALLGPSGSGKTSLLRVIAGLEEPDSGQVVLEHKDATHSTPRERRVGFVFQHYALFRHMTVFENVAFGLRVKPRRERLPEAELRQRVQALLKLVQLEVLAERLPSQLSGGQRQRIALARALAVEPRFLLLDEPFGALDAQVRKDLRRWLRRLHDEIHVTSVFVTHDQEEALEVADRVVVMNQGRIEQIGTPHEVYSNPANRFVFSFMGTVNLFQGRLDRGQAHVAGAVLDAPEHADASDVPAVVLVRPHEIELHRHQDGGPAGEATVREVRAIGPLWRVVVDVPGAQAPIEVDLTAERGAELALKAGDLVDVAPRRARVFREDRSPV